MTSKTSVYKSSVVPSSRQALSRLSEQLVSAAEANGFDREELFAIRLALEEAFLNALKHGNMDESEKNVSIECMITPEKFDISVTDDGSGFDPAAVPDPRCRDNLYKPCGRGMLLMRSYMDVVEYSEKGNCVHMIKYHGRK